MESNGIERAAQGGKATTATSLIINGHRIMRIMAGTSVYGALSCQLIQHGCSLSDLLLEIALILVMRYYCGQRSYRDTGIIVEASLYTLENPYRNPRHWPAQETYWRTYWTLIIGKIETGCFLKGGGWVRQPLRSYAFQKSNGSTSNERRPPGRNDARKSINNLEIHPFASQSVRVRDNGEQACALRCIINRAADIQLITTPSSFVSLAEASLPGNRSNTFIDK